MPKRWLKGDKNWVVVNGKVYHIISLKDLYTLCKDKPELFAALVADLDGTLENLHATLYQKCYDSLKEKLDFFKQGKPINIEGRELTSAEVQAWINDGVRWLAWKSNKMMSPPCPWDNCPPVSSFD
jgi:hypothetical protein